MFGALFSCRRGVAAVEFALATPILLVTLVGMADFGLAVNEKMRLYTAARAGAQAGLGDATATATITQAVTSAANLDAGAVTVTVAQSCGCADGTTAVCGTVCADASTQRGYVTVTVNESYAMLLNYPGFTNPVALSAAATLRTN
jgi:Flp pilus assembly protein TadG